MIEVLDNMPDFERIVMFMNEQPLSGDKKGKLIKGVTKKVGNKRSHKATQLGYDSKSMYD